MRPPNAPAGNVSHTRFLTFLFLHDLQFMDSRGSLLIRRVGNRSIPTCGRAMPPGWEVAGCMPFISQAGALTLGRTDSDAAKVNQVGLFANSACRGTKPAPSK